MNKPEEIRRQVDELRRLCEANLRYHDEKQTDKDRLLMEVLRITFKLLDLTNEQK